MTFRIILGFAVLIGVLIGINSLSQWFGNRFFYKQIQDDLSKPKPNPNDIGMELERATSVVKRWDGILAGALMVAIAFFPLPLPAKLVCLFIVFVIGFSGLLGKDHELDEKTAVKLMRDFSHGYMHEASKDRVEALLGGILLMNSDGMIRLGIERTRDWGGGNALQILENATFPENFAHRSLAKDAAKLLRDELAEAGAGKLNDVANLLEGRQIERGVYWNRLVEILSQGEAKGEKAELVVQNSENISGFLEDVPESKPVMDFLLRNVPLTNDIHHVICERCYVRAEVWEEYKLARCPRCMEADRLKEGVLKLVGTIDGRRIGLQKDGDYVVQLWKEGEQVTKVAEIDELVVWGRKEMNYSWAVSASIEAIRNAFPEKVFKVDVQLHEDLELDANTRQLIENFGGGPANIFSERP